MFDLFRSRAKLVRYMLGALLIIVSLSMVVTLIPGFMGMGGPPEDLVAKIGGDVLTARDVQLNIQQQLRNKTFPREMVSVYVPIIVNQMISERAVAYEAERLGFQVTDADVALTVKSIMPQLFPGGKFVGQKYYAQYLEQMNLTIPEFEKNIRTQMLLLRLTNLVLEGEVVTDREIEAAYRIENEKIKVDYIAISPSKYRPQVKVTRKEELAYFEKNKASFKIGEKRDARILVADQPEIAKTVKVPEEELRKAYEASIDRFRTPERVKVRHILLKTNGKTPEEIKKIKAKAEDIRKQLLNGADFAALAKKYSEDTGTAIKGGNLGWIAHGQTVSNFEKVAFSLKPGTISPVISTEYGFHVIQVLAKQKAHLRSFAEVKKELAGERSKQLIYDKMQKLIDQAHVELLKNPLEAEAIGKRLGLLVYKVNKVGLKDPIPEVGGSADMQDAIRSLALRGVTAVYQMGTDRLGVAVVTKIYPERPAKFEEVVSQIRQRLINEKLQKILSEKKKQLQALLKSSGGNLHSVARRMGLQVKTSPEFTRTGNVKGLGAAAYMREAFDKPVGSIVGPLSSMDETIVCKVVAKIPADMTQLPAKREMIANQIKRIKARQRRSLFEDGVLTQLIKEGKVKIYNSNIRRLEASYKS